MDFKGDIHTNGAPKSGQENLLKKDNVATPEARSFDIKVGDPMDKIDGKKGEQKPHKKKSFEKFNLCYTCRKCGNVTKA